VWDALWEAGEPHGIRPAGIRALDVARVEAGLILIEAEYTSARHAISPEQQYSPFEIGLGAFVDLAKPAFVGKHALELERGRGGPARRLVGLDLDWTGIEALFTRHDLPPLVSALVHRDPVPVYKDGQQVGRATSITWGPTIKKMVAFGSLPPGLAEPGTRVSVEWSVEGERGKVAATVVPLPFLDLPRKRA
jgi:aminomethyltransferase